MEFAHIAWGNIESQFYGYIVGYKRAADTIIDSALESGSNAWLDTCIFPACFMYRQYLELALKNIFLSNTRKSKEEKIDTIKRCGHNLPAVWTEVRALIEQDFPDEDPIVIEAVESYIKQFAAEDKNSFSYRYPINKELALCHSEKKINLPNLKARMGELESFLSSVSMGMSVHRDFENEMMAYYEKDLNGYYY